jgi:Domain of unknown function (DUF4190)
MSSPESNRIDLTQAAARVAVAHPLGRDRVLLVRVGSIVGLALSPGLVVASLPFSGGAISVAIGVVGVLLIAATWIVAPAERRTKAYALVLLGVPSLFFLLAWVLGLGLRAGSAGVVDVGTPLLGAVGTAGWLVLRGRPARSYLALILFVVALAMGASGISFFSRSAAPIWVTYVLLPLLVVWEAWLLSRPIVNSTVRESQAAVRERTSIETQARAVQQWQGTYALANPGQPIPAPPIVIGSDAYGASNRTNTMAILAIIFGFFVGILGIVFGHIALSQIRRTGEGGRGLAITGLVFGYFGVGLAVILLVVDLAAVVRFLA